MGLISLSDDCLYLTRTGEFWAFNLAHILIYFFQMQLDEKQP